MNEKSATGVLTPLPSALPDTLARVVEPVCQELTRAGEMVREVRCGPVKPAAEFLDIETVRLRIAQEQRGQPLPGQTPLVERLRALSPERQITYVILATAGRQAKCYVDTESQQLVGVLWLAAANPDAE